VLLRLEHSGEGQAGELAQHGSIAQHLACLAGCRQGREGQGGELNERTGGVGNTSDAT
jgi:hypothetical protein